MPISPFRFLGLVLLLGCGQPSVVVTKQTPPSAQALTQRRLSGDILSVELRVDLAKQSATGFYRVAVTGNAPIELEITGLAIDAVYDANGHALATSISREGSNRILTVDAAAGTNLFAIDYRFALDTQNGLRRGLSAERQNTLLWPDACSALFPCHSSPADGARMGMRVTGVPRGMVALYPKAIPNDAPSYMLALAYGRFNAYDGGTTSAGTRITGYLSADRPEVAGYTQHLHGLRAEFDWLERTIGPYMFGSEVGTINVPNGFGGMEHHPIWYVENLDADTHEAAHGWFGNGVRIQCWEDLVLSEAFAEYLSIRVRRALAGRHDGYARYLSQEGPKANPGRNRAWYPHTCNQRSAYDTLGQVYAQGSGFLMAFATEYGEAELDHLISDFYLAHAGQALRMQDFIDFAQARTRIDVQALAARWLL